MTGQTGQNALRHVDLERQTEQELVTIQLKLVLELIAAERKNRSNPAEETHW